MSITDTLLHNIKPISNPFKLWDGKGLFLIVNPNGSKWWRIKYRFKRKENTLSLGIYPEITLAEAREKCNAIRKLLADGIDPSENRKIMKAEQTENNIKQENNRKNGIKDNYLYCPYCGHNLY